MSPTDLVIAAVAFTLAAAWFEAMREAEDADPTAWAVKSFRDRVKLTYQRLKRAAGH
jgi:hypothetical protein